MGSLGVNTFVVLQLREARKYIETTYHPLSSMAEVVEKLQEVTADPELDYEEGILYSRNQGAIVTARMTDAPINNARVQ